MATFIGLLVTIAIINLMVTLSIWYSLTNTLMNLKSNDNIVNSAATFHAKPSLDAERMITTSSHIIKDIDMAAYYTKIISNNGNV